MITAFLIVLAVFFAGLIALEIYWARQDQKELDRDMIHFLLRNIQMHKPGSPERFAAAKNLRDFKRENRK